MVEDEYYIWGAGTYGSRLIDFMKNELPFKAVIDNDPAKHGKVLNGVPIISYDDAKKNVPDIKIVIAMNLPTELRSFLLYEGFTENKDFYIIHDFMPHYFWKKHKSLVVKSLDCPVTSACNMKCEGCQNYIPAAANSEHRSYESIRSDVDLIFNHLDSIMNFNICIGESLLNEELPEVCSYIYEHFSGRYSYLSVQTNGSIVPTDSAMRLFSKTRTIFGLSNNSGQPIHRENLIAACDKFGVTWYSNMQSNRNVWFDCGDPRIVYETNPEELRKLFANCWCPRTGVHSGLLYLCGMQAWSHLIAETGVLEPGDAFDLHQSKTEASRFELYKILTRHSERGYISHCMRCKSVMTPYVQKFKHDREERNV